jgi:rare lipoprotein A
MVERWRCIAAAGVLCAHTALTSGAAQAMETEPATTIIPKMRAPIASAPLTAETPAEAVAPLSPSFAADAPEPSAPPPDTGHIAASPGPASTGAPKAWSTTLTAAQPAAPKQVTPPRESAANQVVPLPTRGGPFLAASASAGMIAPPAKPSAAGKTPSLASGPAGKPASGSSITAASFVGAPPALVHREIGMASFYRDGGITASGVKAGGMSAAHRKLPFGSRVKVKDVRTGKEVVVTITDRGPFKKGRVIDLSHMAARELGITGRGIARVEVIAAN